MALQLAELVPTTGWQRLPAAQRRPEQQSFGEVQVRPCTTQPEELPLEEPEVDFEPELVLDPDVEPVPVPLLDPELELDPELDPDPKLDPDPDPELEHELELELDAVPVPELDPEVDFELVPVPLPPPLSRGPT